MVFYKIEAMMVEEKKGQKEEQVSDHYTMASEIAETSEAMFFKSGQKAVAFVSYIRRNRVVFGVILETGGDLHNFFKKFKAELPFKIKNEKAQEITFEAINNLISTADNNSYIYDDDRILETLGISELKRCYSNKFGESMLDDAMTREQIYKIADDLLFGGTLIPELDRIYTESSRKGYGHPVHYLLMTDNRDTRKTVYRTLISALYNNKRIKNRRYCFVDYSETSDMPGTKFDALYKSCDGGAVIIRYIGNSDDENEFANRGNEVIKNLCEIAMKYKNKVLTVICVSKGSNKIKQSFLSSCGETAFVEICEDVVYGERAKQYLVTKAREYKVRPDKKLTQTIENDDSGFTAEDLNKIFDKWYDHKLRDTVYPQYKTAVTVKEILQKEKPKGSAYEKLQSLIGLDEAKKVMNQALNYFKAQKLFADRGLKSEQPSMHMIFTGNPGTAKTTVARLFAQIMKENNLLPKGDMVEVGRADLVGKYVGSTAPRVKQAFKEAKGGVLFIDEAYSLVDDRDGLFGDEAINTIVQEMENNRDDTVVIFAGYPDKMEGFLNKNPGLRSRIAFHIPFEDYNPQELCDIAALIAKEKGFSLSSDALQKLKNVFGTVCMQSDFGNGRYARNVIEKAKMAQANRIVQMNFDKITDEDIFTICDTDIEMPKLLNKNIKIGFCA